MSAAFTEGRASRVDNEYLWRKDGTGVPVEYGATPVLKDGVIVGSVVSFTNITERKETEERINAYFNASSDGLLLLSPERGFIDANPRAASMFGVGSVAELGPSLRLNGVVLTDGAIVVGDSLLNLLVNASLTVDPSLFAQPPDGYTVGDTMEPVEGTWERRPSP